ncbi:hypothetical protein CYMTET_55075 [Cymbomonas tetramitiformis]|uniref:Uncharacterized protein n=1 Tax=Cymbomonas tetramitiformis TaxID=36881 RepID=A0AAE0BEI8_9CHLO|nr:hypothetical protein CYMTET_55075 [Cymbomonas tetramitiformis]
MNDVQSKTETAFLQLCANVIIKPYYPYDFTDIWTVPKTLIKYQLKNQEVGHEEGDFLKFASHVVDMAQFITKARNTISKQEVPEELLKILVSFLFDATICAALFSASAEDIHVRFDKAVKKASIKLTGHSDTINFVLNTLKQRLKASRATKQAIAPSTIEAIKGTRSDVDEVELREFWLEGCRSVAARK